MTQTAGLLDDIRGIAPAVAVPHHDPPSTVLRRRIVVVVVLVIGGALLGYSLTRQPGDESFYWLTLALAAGWGLGALPSRPLPLRCGRVPGPKQPPGVTRAVPGVGPRGAVPGGGPGSPGVSGAR